MSIVFTAGCNNLLCNAFCNFVQSSDLKSVFCNVYDKSMTAGSESGYSIKLNQIKFSINNNQSIIKKFMKIIYQL